MTFKTIDQYIGNTPLVALQKIWQRNVAILCKLEFSNPGGSVKDRAALGMIDAAVSEGRINPGDTVIEATAGNTGIALAMICAIRGYRLILLMPENLSKERKQLIRAYGAELVLTPADKGMEYARDLASTFVKEKKGIQLNQFANPANPAAHYNTTGPEIWRDSRKRVTHFVASTGTTGTLVGVASYLKEQNPHIRIVAVRPKDGESIPGIRKWQPEYVPAIFDDSCIDEMREVDYEQTRQLCRRLAVEEGIFCGPSSGGNVSIALQLAEELEAAGQNNAVVVTIICDNGERYLSTNLHTDS